MKTFLLFCLITFITACGPASNPPKRSIAHITKDKIANVETLATASIPKVVSSKPYVPVPKPYKKPETYTVVVNNVPASELLFAIARDADIDIDIVGDITGTVSLNAIDKTLSQILERISQHTGIKYQFKNNYLIIEKDSPYLKTYHIDYVNMNRVSESKIELATQIGSVGTATSGGETGNNSFTTVTNNSNNEFWLTLEKNLNEMVNVTTRHEKNNLNTPAITSSASTKSANVIVNKESGLVTIFATDRQHKKIASYIHSVINKVRKQVLIEATIVEVELSDEHQSGVDWSILNTTGLSLTQNLTGANLTAAPFFAATFTDPGGTLGDVTGTIKALEKFGDVQVLSSPKIIALNNQTAVLKVVDNRVYFTTSVDVTPATTTTPRVETFTSELHTVPIGFVMNVTPSISENKEVLLNVRPTISRILRFVNDPNPALATAGVTSAIPEIQVREMESLLRMNDGQVAIIGGLMQDKIEKNSSVVPGLSDIPLIGGIFGYTEDKTYKTELLIFIKSTLVNSASVDDELKDYYDFIPSNTNKTHLSPSERVK